jgi:hypothetical protein
MPPLDRRIPAKCSVAASEVFGEQRTLAVPPRPGSPKAHMVQVRTSLHAENGFATSWAQSMKSLANGLSVRFFIVMISIANG